MTSIGLHSYYFLLCSLTKLYFNQSICNSLYINKLHVKR